MGDGQLQRHQLGDNVNVCDLVQLVGDSPLHMLGLHPTVQLCCFGASAAIRRERLSKPEFSKCAGFVTISSKRPPRP